VHDKLAALAERLGARFAPHPGWRDLARGA
jgi:hypothetical protein